MAQFDEARNELYLTPEEDALMDILYEIERDLAEYIRESDSPNVDEFIEIYGYSPTEKGYDDLARRIEEEAV